MHLPIIFRCDSFSVLIVYSYLIRPKYIFSKLFVDIIHTLNFVGSEYSVLKIPCTQCYCAAHSAPKVHQSGSITTYSTLFSGSDNDIDMEIQSSIDNETIKRKKKNRRKWIPLCAYNDKNDVIKNIKDDGIWSKTHTNITNEGKRIYYRCDQVKRCGKQCPASIHVLYHSENKCVAMYKTEDDHLHKEPRSIGTPRRKIIRPELLELRRMI